MKEFKHLDFPRLREYYTKYPQGYTLYESLLDILERINEMTDVVNLTLNQWEQIETWVLTELQNYSIDQLQSWLDDGTLEDVINDALFESKADKTELTSLETQLSQIATINADEMIQLENGNVTRGLQRSIDTALHLNKARVLWSGVYELENRLIIDRLNTYNNTQIIFFGGGQLKKASTFTGDRLIQINVGFHDEDNIVFENISFDGVDKTINGIDTFKENVPYNLDGTQASDGNLSKFVSFKNCTFHRFYRGVRLSSLSYNFISCLFQDNIYGMFLNLAANNNSFIACQYRRNTIGAHIKQLSAGYGTMNNVFFNCIFESNRNQGIINENTSYTSLFGGYFENNCYNVDPLYHNPPRKCDIQMIGSGSAGFFNMRGVFFWSNETEVTIYADEIAFGNIESCGHITIDANVIRRLDCDIHSDNISVRSQNYTSTFNVRGIEYTVNEGVKYRTNEYEPILNQKKSILKNVDCQQGNNPKVTFANLKINNTTNAKIKISAFIIGMTAGGNTSLEGFIERSFLIGRRTTNGDNSYKTTPLHESIRGFAVSDSGAGAGILTGNAVSETSEIQLEKVNDTIQNISITNLRNDSITNWGYAIRYRARLVVEIEGVQIGGNTMTTEYTTEIIELT